MSRAGSRSLFIALIFGLVACTSANAAPSAQQQRQADAMLIAIKRAGVLFSNGDLKKCATAVSKVQKEIAELTADGNADMIEALGPALNRLKNAHLILTTKGLDLPPLELPTAKKPADSPEPDTPADATTTGAVSFKNDVAKILVGKCGRCHVSRASGNFSMATFANLMKGSAAGKVVFAKDPIGSPLIEIIESGDMPRGGGKLSAAELGTLKKWISEGAQYDGGDPGVNLTAFAGDAGGNMTRLAVTQSTGKETVSFSNDIAKHLVERCHGCHIGAMRPSGRLNMTTIAGLMRGGESGPAIVPGKPGESLLIQKLKGTGGGNRMPLRREPFSDEVIAKFEKWIAEGATFDGPNKELSVNDIAALSSAMNATHEELAATRVERARNNWMLVMAGVNADVVESENFYAMGNVGEKTLADYVDRAEQLVPKIAEMLGAPTDKPLFKGRMTLYFVPQRYDYSEFGKMVEKRTLPSSWRGHWNFTIVDSYGAMIPPRLDAYSADALIAQQIAGAYVKSLDPSVPRWLAEGTARTVAAKIVADDARVAGWDDQVSGIVSKMQSPDDFLKGKLGAEDADIASYSFVRFLMNAGGGSRFRTLLASVKSGKEFDQAFSASFNGSPSQGTNAWKGRAASSTVKRPTRTRTRTKRKSAVDDLPF